MLSSDWSSDFETSSQQPPANTLLLGDARVTAGALLLTEARKVQLGSFVIEPTTRAAPYYSARFNALLGGGLGGDGLSFCYGELNLTAPFGEVGVEEGLCLNMRTHTEQVVEIVCNGTRLASVFLGGDLRPGSFMPVTIKRASV